MAELLSLEDLAHGHLNAKTLDEVANGDENTIVTTRTGRTYPSVEKALKAMFQNGGLPAEPFATKTSMEASALIDGDYAQVTDSPVLDANGLYIKQNGVWVKSIYDPFAESKKHFRDNGFAVIAALASDKINYVTATKTLVFTEPFYVFTGTERYYIDNQDDLVFDANSSYRIDFELTTNQLVVKRNSVARSAGSIVAAFVVVTDGGIKTSDFIHTTNGVLYDPMDDVIDYVSKTGYASIVGTSLSNIDYTTTSRTLNFKNILYIFSGTNRYLLTTPISIPLPSNTPYRLEYVIATGELVVKPYSVAPMLGNIIIGFFTASDIGLKTQDFAFVVDGGAYVAATATQSLVGALHGSTSAVSINTQTAKIIFSNVRVVADTGVTAVINQTLDYASSAASAASHYLYYSKATATISYQSSNAPWLNQDDLVLVASFIPKTGEIRGLPQPYVRNSQQIGGAPTTNTGVLLSTSDSLDFDFSNQQIVVSSLTQILHGGLRVLVPVQTIDISSYTSSLWFALVTDTTGILQVIATNAAYSRDLIIIGAFKKDTKSVANIDNYSVNGVSNTADPVIPEPTVSAAKLPSLGWSLDGVYTAPTMPAYRSSGADPLRAIDVTSTTINDWFDSLVAADPDYVTKTHLGNEYTGLPINEYRFKPDMGGSTKPIKVLIHGGTHGEPMSYLLPYHMMQLITEHWQDDPLLEALRFGVEFSIVPAVNAWGITNGNDRYNSRGINLNRNYPANWSATGDNTGASPLSELEAQYAYANMVDFDAHVAIDLHSYGTTEAGEFLWITVDSSAEGVTVGASMMNRMRQKWVKETPNIVAASALDRNAPTLATGSTMLTMKELGATAITFEVGTKIIGEQPIEEHYSALAVRYGVEALINYLIILLRRNA